MGHITGIHWKRELIRYKRGAIQIMVGRPRKQGYRTACGVLSRRKDPDNEPMRRLDGILDEPTVIYVMEAPPLVKIGISKVPRQRIKGIQTSNGQIVRIYWYRWMDGLGARKLEAEFHKENRGKVGHAHGEWYYLGPASAVDRLTRIIRRLGLYSIHETNTQEAEQAYDIRTKRWA